MAQKCKTGQIWDKKIGKCVSTDTIKKTSTVEKGKGYTKTTTVAKGALRGQRSVGTRVGKGGEVSTVMEYNTPKGKRYYTGKGKSKKMSIARQKSDMAAQSKYMTTPSDSLASYNVDRYLKGKKLKKKKKGWWK
jgi:hypothetical protein